MAALHHGTDGPGWCARRDMRRNGEAYSKHACIGWYFFNVELFVDGTYGPHRERLVSEYPRTVDMDILLLVLSTVHGHNVLCDESQGGQPQGRV